MSRYLIIGAAGLLAVVLMFLYSNAQEPASHQGSLDVELSSITSNKVEPSQNHTLKKDLSVLPSISSKGNEFELYEGLKDVFDAIILEADSQHIDTLMSFAKAHCNSVALSSAGCQQFTALFARYINYKQALANVEAQTVNYASALEEIQYRLDLINNLKHSYFSNTEIEVLFGFEQNIETSALARYQIAADQTLDQQQKQQLIEHHFANLPEQEKQAFEPSLQIQALQKIKSLPDSQQNKLAMIEAQFGHEAAQRLQATWDKQAAFKDKVAALKASYGKVEKQNQLNWLQQHFPPNLAKRARVLLNQGG